MTSRGRSYSSSTATIRCSTTILCRTISTGVACEFGSEGRDRYWGIYEQLRAELGYADYLGALQRYRLEDVSDPHLVRMYGSTCRRSSSITGATVAGCMCAWRALSTSSAATWTCSIIRSKPPGTSWRYPPLSPAMPRSSRSPNRSAHPQALRRRQQRQDHPRTLGISPLTLRKYLHHINRKLRTHNRLEAVTHAQRRALLN